MANIGRTFSTKYGLEGQLQTMFANEDRFVLFANDFTEEGFGDEAPQKLCLYYVRVKANVDVGGPPQKRADIDVHVGTWAKGKRKGWIFTKSYELLRVTA